MTNTRIPRLVPAPRFLAGLVLVLIVASPAAAAPQVPRVVKFSGVIGDARGPVTAAFAIYAEPSGGSPLWEETQTVTVDAQGRYVVALGGTRPDGLPGELFANGEARWLGVRAEGHDEGPRVALLSVPYALKAADAETVAGKPLSAFVLAGDTTGVGADGLTYVDTRVLTQGVSGPSPSLHSGSGATNSVSTAGTANYLGLFTDSANLGNSALFQTPAGRVGLNTTAPQAPLHVMANETPGAFVDVYSGDAALSALPVVYRAARGTATAPLPVLTDDILGGMAVRGYSPGGWTGGRGQVMFRAAENWGDESGTCITDGWRHLLAVHDDASQRTAVARADADRSRRQRRHRNHRPDSETERRRCDRKHIGRCPVP